MRKQLCSHGVKVFLKVVSWSKAIVEATLQTNILGEQIYIAHGPLATLQQSMEKDIWIIRPNDLQQN
jgi:hypothetical protein